LGIQEFVAKLIPFWGTIIFFCVFYEHKQRFLRHFVVQMPIMKFRHFMSDVMSDEDGW
jgi:hypothetical protein